MEVWNADITNDPSNDYEVIVEILCNNEEIGVIKKGINGLEFVLYPRDRTFIIPLGWFCDLLKQINI